MKLLHTSDWHLGATENERLLKDDQVFFIEEICKIIEREKVDAVLLAGDVYDRSLAGAEAMKLYDYAMTKICKELGVPVISIAGNHDGASQLSSCNRLLEEAGLHICGSLTKEVAKVTFGDVDIYMIPWFTAEKVKSLFPEKAEEIKSLEAAYKVVCDNIRSSFVEGRKNIAVSHAFITNAETSTSDRAAEIGYATQVGASVFDGFDYVALGHIHKPQNVNARIRYSGTPMIYSFGKEEKQSKSVTIIDTDSMQIDEVELNLLHQWNTIEGTLEELKNPSCSDEIRNGYVRLHVTDSFVGYENTAILKEIYPNALDISGKSFMGDTNKEKMSITEFRALENSPMEIFKKFCLDNGGEEADEHLISLFENAMADGSEEVEE